LLSVRRSPGTLAAVHRDDVLRAALLPLTSSVDGTSCFAAGVDGELLAGANTTVPVIPASNLKLLTAAVAIDVLGAGSVFTTDVEGAAPAHGVVTGNLYLVGGGDPLLSEQWYTQVTATRKRPPINATSIEALADAVVAAGVTSVTGAVVADDSRYDSERYPPGWSAAVRASTDGAPVGALVVDDSLSQTGAQATDPAVSAAATFTRLLAARGVTFGAAPSTGPAPSGTPVVASVHSQPLSAVVNEMLVTSDNLTAEMLVKEVGLKVGGKGSRVAGMQAITEHLTTWGISLDGVHLVDGSGLSRENTLTCTTLYGLLQHGSATDVVGSNMATGGENGSTLDGRFEQPGLAGVLRAKTGTLTGVKALCGYFPFDGAEVSFVLVLNGASAAHFIAPWNQLGAALLAATAAPTAQALAPRQS
jgi:D-alanyl-D-alanine carboxypeptidase/D-alanyl-D-alanine-endopeptidase (penicillin-binding protein 4)